MKLSYYLLLLVTLFSKDSSGAGFLPDEIVHLGDSIETIQNLQVYDETVSFNGTELVSDKVTQNIARVCDSAVKISFQGATLTVTPNQLLFLPKSSKQWVEAKDLKVGDLVLSISGDLIAVVATEELKEVMKFHHLTIQDQHNLFVTKLGILVHNEPVTATFGMMATSKAVATTIGVAATTACAWFGYKDLTSDKYSSNSPFPAISDCYTPAEKEQLKRDEQAAKQAVIKQTNDRNKAASDKKAQARKAQQEKELAHERACVLRSHERIAREKLAKEANAKEGHLKAVGAQPLVKKAEEHSLNVKEETLLGVKDKVIGTERPVEELETKEDEAAKSEPEKKLTDDEVKKVVKELTEKTKIEEDKHSKIYAKPEGDASDMNKDFDSLPFDDVKEKQTDKGNIRIGEFSNGWKAVARHSTDSRPTLEIQMGNRSTKIRYGEK